MTMNTEDIRVQFDLIAKQYDEGRRCFIPCFDDFYIRSVSLLKQIKPEATHIVDLGAGTGLLSQQMYQLYPQSKFSLIDLSQDMLEVARQRFAGFDQFNFLVEDYTKTIPSDAVIICSALSIHHLENGEKQNLYATIYNSLPQGGIFINLDQFCAESPEMDKAWNNWWMDYIDQSGITEEARIKWLERKKLDKEVSIQTSLQMLANAGFKQIDCVYQFLKFGTIVAMKR